MDDEWEDIGEPGVMPEFRTVIDGCFDVEPDPLMTTIEIVSGIALSALTIWLIVRLINWRSLRRLPPDAP